MGLFCGRKFCELFESIFFQEVRFQFATPTNAVGVLIVLYCIILIMKILGGNFNK